MVVCVDLVFVNLISALYSLIHALKINKLIKVPGISLLQWILVLLGGFPNLILHVTLRCMVQKKLLGWLTVGVEIHTCLFEFHKVSEELWLPLQLFFTCVFQHFEGLLLLFHLVYCFLKELLIHRKSLFKPPNLLMSYVVIDVLEIYSILFKNRHWL